MSVIAAVVIYSTTVCPYCIQAKQLLAAKGVEYTEVLIDKDMARREEMLARSNGARTVPQIFIGDTHVGGFDDLVALDKSGKLDKLLEG